MAVVLDVLAYAGFLATPLVGLGVLQVLLRSGLVAEGTEDRKIPLTSTSTEYFTYRSRLHRLAAMAGFFLGWFLALGAYVVLLDTFYFGGR